MNSKQRKIVTWMAIALFVWLCIVIGLLVVAVNFITNVY